MTKKVVDVPRTVLKADGTRERKNASVIVEHKLDIYADGQKIAGLICTNELLEELVVGKLVTEGYIKRKEDIAEIRFDSSCEKAEVYLVKVNDQAVQRRQNGNAFMKYSEGLRCGISDYEEVFEIAKVFSEGMPLHSETQGTHSCLMANGNEILFSCEDIGRHNTVDKAVGYATMNDIDLSKCMLYISGRVPTDMVQKVIRSGIPVLVSKAVPTADAIKLAKENGVKLIVKAYPDQIEICD